MSSGQFDEWVGESVHRRHHDRQVAAARQTLIHLQAAYDQTAPTALAALARHEPQPHTVNRYAHTVREIAPAHAEQILTEPAWDALTAVLAAAEAAGHDHATVLQRALTQRSLDDAQSPAEVLTWRIKRLGERHAPSHQARAHAAQAASTRLPHSRPTPQATADTPPAHTPQPPRPHRSR